jgi:hypothetical protein
MTSRTRSYLLFALFLLTGFGSLRAEEFFCQVNVQAPTVGSDQQVYTQMQEAISKYLNLRQWTNRKYEPYERIKARIQIIITDRPAVDYFKGTIQVQLIRPVYNSTYETVVLNIQDKDFNVTYTPLVPLEYNENTYTDNLTSILNYYAWLMLGVDSDSYELNGGAEYFQNAKNVVNLAATGREVGWRNTDGTKNKYWLLDGFLNNSYAKTHNFMYTYHRTGLDAMEKDLPKARIAIMNSIKELDKLNQANPGLYIIRSILDAKQPEIVLIFKDALPNEKRDLLAIMERLDPVNMSLYDAINKGGN